MQHVHTRYAMQGYKRVVKIATGLKAIRASPQRNDRCLYRLVEANSSGEIPLDILGREPQLLGQKLWLV